MASLQQLKSGKWRVAWHVQVRAGAEFGKIYRGSLTFKDRQIARSFRAEIEGQEEVWRSGLKRPRPGTTTPWSKLVKDFFAAELGLGARTRELYATVFGKFHTFARGEENLARLTEPPIRKFLDGLPSAATRNNHLTALKSLLNFAYSHHVIDAVPTDAIAYLRIGDVQKDPPTRKQLADLLRSCPRYLRYRILFLAHTGLRISEALNLRPEHVRDDRLIVMGKGLKRRSIPLDNIARLALKKLGVPVYHKTGLSARKEWTWSLARWAKRATVKDQETGKLKPAPVHPFGPHLCRHWFATQLAEAGVDLGRISRIIGHANPTLTYRVYIHYSDESEAATGHRRHWRRWFGVF